MILFGLFGIGSAIALIVVLRRSAIAGRPAMAIGACQVVWILVQVVMIEEISFLQPLLLLVGVGIAILAARLNGSGRRA